MEIFTTLTAYKTWRKNLSPVESVGFVPTMGALHSGHMKLVTESAKTNTHTVVSIFVNPLQFGPNEDFHRYPRPFEADRKLCEEAGVAAIFNPSVEEFYAADHSTMVDVQGLDQFLCGASRPGHFRGVCTVVLKLFNIIEPNQAYFGQKDIQQAFILKKMVNDLSLNLKMHIVATEREKSGLALSSRNMYLSEDEKTRATALSISLNEAKAVYSKGEKSADILKKIIRQRIEAAHPTRIDYIEAVGQRNLAPLSILDEPSILAVAVFFGNTRLIDNLILE